MKIAYFGLPLGALLLARDGHQLGPVVLSPVDAPGRRRLTKVMAGAPLLDVLTRPEDLDRVDRELSEARPDLLLSWFWTRKLPTRWLHAARLGAFGAHPSLLPRHRGPNPYFWTIDSGDELAGVTVHRLAAEYDTGGMVASRKLAVGSMNSWQLARALDRPSLQLLRETARRFANEEAVAEAPQAEAAATWAPEPSAEALRVDFGWTTERVMRRIRALSPTPGLALQVEGVDLFVTGAERADTYVQALLPGEAEISDALRLRTGDGAVRVTSAVFPGRGAEAGCSGETDTDSVAEAETETDNGPLIATTPEAVVAHLRQGAA